MSETQDEHPAVEAAFAGKTSAASAETETETVETAAVETATAGAELAIAGQRRLVIRRGDGRDEIVLLERDGRMTLNVSITEAGVNLTIGGASLTLEVERDLAISAESISLHGRSDLSLTTEGRLSSMARSVRVETSHGNIELEANDDVKLDGERVLLNCP